MEIPDVMERRKNVNTPQKEDILLMKNRKTPFPEMNDMNLTIQEETVNRP